jgi:hypothetical protein
MRERVEREAMPIAGTCTGLPIVAAGHMQATDIAFQRKGATIDLGGRGRL